MDYQHYQRIRIAVDAGICRATIDNPPINLLDAGLITELARFRGELAADDEVRVLIVDSADPDFFVAHADLNMLQAISTDDTALHHKLSAFHYIAEQFRTIPK